MSDVNKQVNLLITPFLRNKSGFGDQTRIHGEATLRPFLSLEEIKPHPSSLGKNKIIFTLQN